MRLAGTTAIITGAGRGIGRGIAVAFASEGARVVIAEIDNASGSEVASELERGGASATFVPVDVSDADAVDALVKTTLERHGAVDILVNNAALSLGQSFLNTTRDVWERTVAVNQTGTFLCAQRAARAMIDGGVAGRIINVASVNSFAAERGAASYVATKGAVLALTRAMAVDLAPHRILVNAIAPGPIRTEVTAELFDAPAYRSGIERGVPLARAGRVDEVARVAVFLASEDSTFVNGSAVVVDGGFLSYVRLD